jgi:hypothetical protein
VDPTTRCYFTRDLIYARQSRSDGTNPVIHPAAKRRRWPCPSSTAEPWQRLATTRSRPRSCDLNRDTRCNQKRELDGGFVTSIWAGGGSAHALARHGGDEGALVSNPPKTSPRGALIGHSLASSIGRRRPALIYRAQDRGEVRMDGGDRSFYALAPRSCLALVARVRVQGEEERSTMRAVL